MRNHNLFNKAHNQGEDRTAPTIHPHLDFFLIPLPFKRTELLMRTAEDPPGPMDFCSVTMDTFNDYTICLRYIGTEPMLMSIWTCGIYSTSVPLRDTDSSSVAL